MITQLHGERAERVARWKASAAGSESGESKPAIAASPGPFGGIRAPEVPGGSEDNGASPPAPPSSVGTSPDENNRPFGAWGADRMMMKAFGRVCGFLRFSSRDYRLLELTVPELKGAFDFHAEVIGGRTLSREQGQRNPAELDPRPILQLHGGLELLGMESAVQYLGGSNSMLAVHNMIAAARIPGNNLFTAIASIPFELSALISGGAFDPCVRGLRSIYRIGVDNLRSDPTVYAAVRAFLQAEKGGAQKPDEP